MTAKQPSPGSAQRRVLVVEDEIMIRMLLEDMLADLGYRIAASAGGLDEAMTLARDSDFDVAILDLTRKGHGIRPAPGVLARRGAPFVSATGCGERGLPEAYPAPPTLQKPFQRENLEKALAAVAR